MREYTVRCTSTKGVVWLLSQRYVFDEATVLTRRKIRECGILISDLFDQRTKNATDLTKHINKVVVQTKPREPENIPDPDQFKNLLKEQVLYLVIICTASPRSK